MNVSDIFRANAATRPDAVAWIDERRSGVTHAALDAIIDAKLANARPLGLAELESRVFPARLRDGLARLLSPYL